MRRRMSASEFALHLADLDEPSEEMLRWALLMAALHNGPLQRTDKRLWTASDFLPQRQVPRKRKPATIESARAMRDRLKAARG